MKLCTGAFMGAVCGALLLMGCGGNSTAPVSESAADTVVAQTDLAPLESDFIDTLDGLPLEYFVVKNKHHVTATFSNYGARLISLSMPDKQGKLVDIVLGFDHVRQYMTTGNYYGATIGRFANRIADGRFKLDGKTYTLDINDGRNSLHGGKGGFETKVWKGVKVDEESVFFSYESPDGEGGFPGSLNCAVVYRLTEKNELYVAYEYSSDKKTIVNLTNHTYWNLNGVGSGDILGHSVKINAEQFLAVDSGLIPMETRSVKGTALDFTQMVTIGERLAMDDQQTKIAGGIDHNFILPRADSGKMIHAVTVQGEKSGIVMDIETQEPGLQFYTGNFMNGKTQMKSGTRDDFRTGFCMETQHFPNSPNSPSFPTTVIQPGVKVKSFTVHRFRVE